MFLQGHRVSPWIRSAVIDWLIQLQVGFTLLSETLYLTIAILDRYLSVAFDTQCETQAPEVGAFAYITDHA